MPRSTLRVLGFGLWLLLMACNAQAPAEVGIGASPGESADAGKTQPDAAGPQVRQPSEGEEPPPYRISGRGLVQWKRYAAFEADLMGALELSREELCVEMGDKNCIREVHLVSLGGNEPYVSGLMKPSREPLGTTPPVVDRVLLSACSTRARLDAEAEQPLVFSDLDFAGPLPSASDPAASATIRTLYRRLLARDPQPREIELVSQLLDSAESDALSVRDFAALACFTIGSSIEFLFF